MFSGPRPTRCPPLGLAGAVSHPTMCSHLARTAQPSARSASSWPAIHPSSTLQRLPGPSLHGPGASRSQADLPRHGPDQAPTRPSTRSPAACTTHPCTTHPARGRPLGRPIQRGAADETASIRHRRVDRLGWPGPTPRVGRELQFQPRAGRGPPARRLHPDQPRADPGPRETWWAAVAARAASPPPPLPAWRRWSAGRAAPAHRRPPRRRIGPRPGAPRHRRPRHRLCRRPARLLPPTRRTSAARWPPTTRSTPSRRSSKSAPVARTRAIDPGGRRRRRVPRGPDASVGCASPRRRLHRALSPRKCTPRWHRRESAGDDRCRRVQPHRRCRTRTHGQRAASLTGRKVPRPGWTAATRSIASPTPARSATRSAISSFACSACRWDTAAGNARRATGARTSWSAGPSAPQTASEHIPRHAVSWVSSFWCRYKNTRANLYTLPFFVLERGGNSNPFFSTPFSFHSTSPHPVADIKRDAAAEASLLQGAVLKTPAACRGC